jgi:hypothetical protein
MLANEKIMTYISFVVKHEEAGKIYPKAYKKKAPAERYRDKLIELGYRSWIDEEEFEIPEFIVRNLSEEQRKIFDL